MSMKQVPSWLIVFVPDALIAWLMMAITDGELETFWWAWFGLLALQAFFTLKNTLVASLLFRFHGKKILTEACSQFLSANNFPRAEKDEEIDEYFERVAQSGSVPINLRLIAASEQAKLILLEEQAILPVLRVRLAYNTALRRHRETSVLSPASP